jgi:hypothetical protein
MVRGRLTSDRVRTMARNGASAVEFVDGLLPLGLLCSMIIAVLNMNVESHEPGAILLNTWIVIAVVAALWSNREAEALVKPQMGSL